MPLAFHICPSYSLAIVVLVTPFMCAFSESLFSCYVFYSLAVLGFLEFVFFYCVIWELTLLCHRLVICELLFSDMKSVSCCSSFLFLFSNHWIDGSLPVKLLLFTVNYFFLAAAVKGSVSSCSLSFKTVHSSNHSQ